MPVAPEQVLPGSPIRRAELVWGHSELNSLAINVGQYLLTRCGSNDATYVSSARIQHDLHMSDSSVRRAVKHLAAIGLFHVSKRKDNKGWDFRVAHTRADIERDLERYLAEVKRAKAALPGSGRTERTTSDHTARTPRPEVRSHRPEGEEVRSQRQGGPVRETEGSGHTDRHKQEGKNNQTQCSAMQSSCDACTGGCERPDDAPIDHDGPLNGSTEWVRTMLREAAQTIGQELSDADLDRAIDRAAKESGAAKTIHAATEVLAKARKHRIDKVDGALVSFARNAKPNGRAKQHPSMTSTPLTFDEWLANGQLPMQQAALADLEAGNDSDVLREVRKIYDETQGGNQ